MYTERISVSLIIQLSVVLYCAYYTAYFYVIDKMYHKMYKYHEPNVFSCLCLSDLFIGYLWNALFIFHIVLR